MKLTESFLPGLSFLAIAMLANAAVASPAVVIQSESTGMEAHFVGRLWTGEDEPIENGVLIVQNGKILAAGSRDEISIPPTAKVHDHGPAVMIPGLVIAETSIGQPDPDERAVTPQFRAVDGLDLFEEFPEFLAAGITTVHVNPGTRRLIPGQSAVVKLHGDYRSRILRETDTLQVMLTSSAWNPPTVYEPPIGANSGIRPIEPTRPQLASSLAEAVSGLRALIDSSGLELPGQVSDADREILATIAGLKDGGMGVRITARSAAEIAAATRLVKDYQLNAILVDPDFLGTMMDRGGVSGLPFSGYVLFPSSLVGKVSNIAIPDENANQPDDFWAAARLLAEQDCLDKTALGGFGNGELRDVMLQAGLLKRGSFTTGQILAMLTLNAANLLGVGDRVGSLKAGKDADFVLLSGDPFERGTTVISTHVDGEAATIARRPGDQKTRPHIIRAGSIHTADGVVRGGNVVISGQQIAAVGSDVSLPADAEVHDFSSAVIIPGMIDLNSELGLGGPLGDQLQLNATLASQLVSEDKTVQFVRQSGITTALVGSSRMPTPVMAFKLSDTPRAIKDPVALRFEVDGNLTSVEASLRQSLAQGKAYADGWKKYEEQFAAYQSALKAYEAEMKKIADAEAKAKAEAEAGKAAEEAKAKSANDSAGGNPADGKPAEKTTVAPDDKPADAKSAEEKSASEKDAPPPEKKSGETGPESKNPAGPEKPKEPEKPKKVDNLEPWRAVFAGELPVIAVASQQRAIELAVKLLASEYSLAIIVAGVEDADLSLDVLKNPLVSVAIGPQLSVNRDNTDINLAQQLATAGIPFGFQSGAASGSSSLPAAISASTYRGLGPADALRATTSSPAAFLKLGSIGKIAAGHDADLVVLSGPPFDLGTEVLAVMIDGQWVYRQESK